jgi:hypothetical protein
MPRDKLPDDLKELLELCDQGKLFDVQAWLAAGKRASTDGDFRTTPFIAAIRRGFHSLLEVFLRADVIDQDEKDWGLSTAVSLRRMDLIELLASHGADPLSVDFNDEVLWTRNPQIIRWFIDRGADLETGYPIARTFRWGNRQFLGIYMGLRDNVPSARKQAAMALRHHCGRGRMKWVSLLLWAGADPRMVVPDLEYPEAVDPEEDSYHFCSALEEAVRRGQVEVVKKIGLKPGVDDCSALLNSATISSKPELFRLLLEAGGDPNAVVHSETAVKGLVRSLGWNLESIFGAGRPDDVLTCLELTAQYGGRWNSADKYGMSRLRRSLSAACKRNGHQSIAVLRRLAKSGVMETSTFRELMKTPRMREVLSSHYSGVVELRELAGHIKKPVARKRSRSQTGT